MILSVEEVMNFPQFSKLDQTDLKWHLDAIERMIRAYTHNNFQNIAVRFVGVSLTDKIIGFHPALKVGDTVEITKSQINKGLYTVTEISAGKVDQDDFIRLDRELFPTVQRITKIQYPDDIKAGVMKLLEWDYGNGKKIGIKSETLSRHSVTYIEQDSNNTIMGYPASLIGFLRPYVKARF